jgi:hypothetical protein
MLRFILLMVCLAQSALACDEASSNASESQRDSRTFLLELQLNKSGTVHAVQVLMGAGPLRAEAIRASARRKYHARPGYNPNIFDVEVKFPEGTDFAPDIREAMVGGVPSCVYGGIPIQWPLILWVNQLLSSKPLLPFPFSAANSQQ